MTKQSVFIIFILIIIASLLGYNYFAQPFAGRFNNQQIVLEEDSVEEEPLSEEELFLETLSTEQKVALLLAVPLTVSDSFEDPTVATTSSRIEWISDYNPGAVILFGSNVSSGSAQTAVSLIKNEEVDPYLNPLIAVDHEGGTVQRLSGSGFSRLPSWQELCRQDQVAAQISLEQSAQELRDIGVNIVFAPVVDVATSNPALGSRICSGDFELVESRAKLAANVYYQNQILPVFKHFPGIGSVTTDLHTGFASVVVQEQEAQLYRNLLDFYKNETMGIMVSHAGVENQDPDIPCSLSPACVGQLRNNFSNILLFSDDILMKSAQYVPPGQDENAQQQPLLEEVIMLAVIAGNDQIVLGPGITDQELTAAIENIAIAYQANNFLKQAVDQRLLNVLEYKRSQL